MSYHALYRKYRPSTLEDVVGQEYIVKIIKNSLKKNKISHAYMFSGPRGTGKTTMAKILAKNVNCLSPIDGIACGKCKNCTMISEHATTDIIEIDAASNNGVDEIREIRNNINLVPADLKYKVYIIDEVHMLSIGAFNALLKTLEEPPEHIIFILATTDLHKVPVTIISRCQCFEFKRFTEHEIMERLSYIVKQENLEIESGILESIANLADGGLRDAIGMLDKVSSYSDGKLTLDDFEKLNGIVSLNNKKTFLSLIYDKNVASVIQFIDNIYNDGKDISILCQDLLVLCRDFIVNYYMNGSCEYDIQFLLDFVDYFSQLSNEIKLSNNIRILFEVKIFSFMNLNIDSKKNIIEEKKLEDLNDNLIQEQQDINSISDNEQKQALSTNTVDKNKIQEENSNYSSINSIIIDNCFAKANKSSLNQIKEKWELFNDYALDSQYGAVACYIVDGVVRAASDHEIIITFDYESMVNRGHKIITKIENLFDKIFNNSFRVALITTEEWNVKKQEYIDKKNQGMAYEYRAVPKWNDDVSSVIDTKGNDDSIVNQAIQLFGEDIVINN